ncbi:Importin subunit beta-5 [Candida viswanathii]|uniref:Importin subunit beta-5 n=1 Tax=Candida viswanathii TaxID=5486 RepID=A0A367YIS8_9ASCO|nr:Importin subunit beta-5 [Candida viswanathii]
MSELVQLIVDQTNPDNNVRKSAELQFNQLIQQDPSHATYLLLQQARDQTVPIDIRQACLLHLKRLVPQYWSLGFESFIGPPITSEVKGEIRKELLELATSTSQTKLRSGAAYAIVQIASVDYPDEWPELMNVLYAATTQYDNQTALLGGLLVLTDLFDDLITEEQFWEGGVGREVVEHLNDILGRAGLSAEVKTQAIKLYESVLAILRSPEAFATQERKAFVIAEVTKTLEILILLLHIQEANLADLNLRSFIYKIVASIIGQFHSKIDKSIKTKILLVGLQDLEYLSPFYNVIALDGEHELEHPEFEALDVFNSLLDELFQTLTAIQHDVPIRQGKFVQDMITCACITKQKLEEYSDDLNAFVSDTTGLTVSPTVRDSIYDFLTDLNETDSKKVFDLVVPHLNDGDWRRLEAKLFILEGLFGNDTEFDNPGLSVFTRHITNHNLMVTARVFLLLPRYLEKFQYENSTRVLIDILTFGLRSRPRIKMSALVSFTYFKNAIELKTLDVSVQPKIFKLALSLIEFSEEDSLPVLLESIADAISINSAYAQNSVINQGISVVDLIFRIAFKDAANVQLISDATDCLNSLLENITIHDYMVVCESSLPFIFNIMDASTGDYTPELYLALELLSIIVKLSPGDELPPQIFEYAFPILTKILLASLDNQILQSGGEVFNELIKNASKLFLEYRDPNTNEGGIDIMLKIVSKFLSPELSDSAANKCGSIVSSLIDQFQNYLLSEFLTQILEATVNRLILAKESATIENLIMVFCQLVLKSPEEMINFLSNMQLQGKSGLAVILPIWFDSYEVTRGYEQIKQNTLALGKIFTLGDPRVQGLIVNGDIIPYEGDLIITRSMAKNMPDRYTQISASLKILKLLVGELQFQCQQPEAEGYLPDVEEGGEGGGDDDEDGWEDMEDIGVPNYEKLKSYVEDDKQGTYDEGLKNLLIQFFRECTVKNLGNFQTYYEELSDDEKKTITENLVF